jgi:hypothetical protein
VVLCKNISSQKACSWPNSVAETCSYINKTSVKIVLVVLTLFTHIIYIHVGKWYLFTYHAVHQRRTRRRSAAWSTSWHSLHATDPAAGSTDHPSRPIILLLHASNSRDALRLFTTVGTTVPVVPECGVGD